MDCDLQRRPSFTPGALGRPTPPVFRHDCCHVLGGYGTTAAEEGGVIGFQAGFERLDPDRVFAGLEHGSSDPLEVVRDRFASPARGRSAEYPESTKAAVMGFVALSFLALEGLSPGAGEFGSLLSGGWIPLLNLLVALKVTLGSWAMIQRFVQHRGLL